MSSTQSKSAAANSVSSSKTGAKKTISKHKVTAAASDRDVHDPHALAHDHAIVDDVGGRKATHVDADARDRNLKRLRRIEGQVRGLQKMVEDDRYCADVLTQIASVHEALRSVGRELMRNHLKHCATGAIQAGEPMATAMYDELVDMMYKHSR